MGCVVLYPNTEPCGRALTQGLVGAAPFYHLVLPWAGVHCPPDAPSRRRGHPPEVIKFAWPGVVPVVRPRPCGLVFTPAAVWVTAPGGLGWC